ncbi:MAG: proline--tRNA ligase [Phycisphaerales bacterium]|nr:proline--tRNA ligase [Phycisphaerales bacterium]
MRTYAWKTVDRWSQTLIPTAREVPAEAVIQSHQLMLRAGLIRQLTAGIYDWLPLGWRVMHRVMNIIRQEMADAGAIEVMLPAMIPMDLMEKTGRDVAYGPNLFRLNDRHGRPSCLGPTHEEVIVELVKGYVSSYKQLPLNLYQLQAKFRDEFRPRFGLLRCREFMMKDAYSFHTTVEGPGGLDETYDRMYTAYERIFDRAGLDYTVVEAEAGPIGGSASHEFMVNSEVGEDTILKSDKGNYAANMERCDIGERSSSLDGPPTAEIEPVHTPNLPGIDDVAAFLRIEPSDMLKTLVCRGDDGVWTLGVVRGNHDLNESKLKQAAGVSQLELADDAAAREAGFAIGFVSPRVASKMDDVRLFIDPDAAQDRLWVTGDDRADYHVRHFNWRRDTGDVLDTDRVQVADIRNAQDGDPSPRNDGGVLRESKGIEVGHVFKLGSKYSDALGLTVSDDHQRQIPVVMGCYGIGPGRIVVSAIETHADDDGIVWPSEIAPYDVLITPIKWEGEMRETATRLADALGDAGLDVLIDDRTERAGVKFKDADLIGIPIRLTIGDKALAQGCVEFKRRAESGRGELVKIEDVVARCNTG